MRSGGHSTEPDQRPGILCLSHLAWDHVWQRPQQILSRLARHSPIHYVAEPEIVASTAGEPHLRPVAVDGGLRAWQPAFPDRPEVIGRWRETYARLVRDLLVRDGWAGEIGGTLAAVRPLVAWFYTPTPWYLLDQLPARLVVYDAMDELADFRGAATDLREREERLLAGCDLVFVGGRSLYAARKDRHPRVHLFPSGVDAAHFARALNPATEIPPEIADLPRPVLGYYGVVDERLDLGLLGALARRRPDWSIVVVGPVAKLAPEELPVAPNLRYVGRQPYARLPAFLRGFDVCLMPFALNAATRAISPTKALEYMAARKPIVSTPVPDVVATWPGAVRIASGADAFVGAVAGALAETTAEHAARVGRQEAFVASNAWDRVAEEMGSLVDAALAAETADARADGGSPVGTGRACD
ncbi:MAG: glycosyltransferase [Chloroflexota bacterium]|nr:glycosyltransferase [Chloroflexota bacterium]